MCAACPQNVSAAFSPWMSHVMLLHQLVEAGCRFHPDDLTLDEWLGISQLRAAIHEDAYQASKESKFGSTSPPIMPH